MLVFHQRLFPFVVLVSLGDLNEDTITAYLRGFKSLAERNERYVTLSDSRYAGVPNAHFRRRLAEMSNEIEDMCGHLSVASAAVLSSQLMVGAARAVGWLRGTEMPVHYTRTAREGLAHLSLAADVARITIPPAANALCAELDRRAQAGIDVKALLDV